MEVDVNWLAVVLATVSSMVVGSIWYAKSVFGTKWQKLVKLDSKDMKSGAGRAIGITIVVSFITAYVLAHVTFLSEQFFHAGYVQSGLTTAFWMWLGFVAARQITHDAFEQRPWQLTAMNAVHELVTLLIMGLIIGLLPPA